MRITERTLFVDDVEAAAAFYEKLLGTPPAYRGKGIAVFHAGEVDLLVHARYDPGPGQLPCEDHVGFGVEDVDAACADLVRAGLTLERPPRDYDWGRSAYVRDPAGNLLEIQARRS